MLVCRFAVIYRYRAFAVCLSTDTSLDFRDKRSVVLRCNHCSINCDIVFRFVYVHSCKSTTSLGNVTRIRNVDIGYTVFVSVKIQ